MPIYAFTANIFLDYKLKALSVGFTEYLTKPINLKQIANALHNALVINNSHNENE